MGSINEEGNSPYEDAAQAPGKVVDAATNAKGLYDDAKYLKNAYDKRKKNADDAKQTQQAAQQTAQNAQNTGQAAGGTAEAAGATAMAGKNTGETVANTGDAAAKTTQGAEQVGEALAEAGQTAEKAGEAAEAAKTAAEAGATAAGAASTAGVSLAVQAAIKTLKATGTAMSDLLTGEDHKMGLGAIIAVPVITIIFLVYMFSFYLTTNSSGEIENYHETEYADKADLDYSSRNKNYSSEKSLSALGYNGDMPYLNALEEYKSDTDEALKGAIMEQATSIVDALHPSAGEKVKTFFSRLLHLPGSEYEYVEDQTLNTFYDNPYPYSLKINSSEYYSIGDYLKTNGFTGVGAFKFTRNHTFPSGRFKTMPEDAINNDLNYIEFNNVMSQGKAFSTYDGTYMDYKAMFDNPDAQALTFEMTIENPDGDVGPTYYGRHISGYQDIPLYNEDGSPQLDSEGNQETTQEPIWEQTPDTANPADIDFCEEKYYYYNVVVKPYGLRELYAIAEHDEKGAYHLTADDEKPGESIYRNHPGSKDDTVKPIKNNEMLDRNEMYDRIYLRTDAESSEIDEDEFGPSCTKDRDRLSFLYNCSAPTLDGSDVVTTGRSAIYYIPLDKLITAGDLSKIIGDMPDDDIEDDIGEADVPVHPFSGDEKAFLEEIKALVIADMHNTGIPASLTAAQALLESRHGTSGLTKKANNLFGIKGSYHGMYVIMKTREVIDGKDVYVDAKFRAYNSWAESISDHSALFVNNPSRYGNLIGETDYKKAARNVQADGYATDPNYASSLISIIEAYGLDKWDKE